MLREAETIHESGTAQVQHATCQSNDLFPPRNNLRQHK